MPVYDAPAAARELMPSELCHHGGMRFVSFIDVPGHTVEKNSDSSLGGTAQKALIDPPPHPRPHPVSAIPPINFHIPAYKPHMVPYTTIYFHLTSYTSMYPHIPTYTVIRDYPTIK